ncbi:MAG: hypothetical protein ABS910_01915 [Arthrobacter sp.]
MGWGEFWPAAADWAITWIPVLGPLGILVTALVAYVGYRQKLEADRRAQWWVRAQWALEASLSANPRRSLAGLAVLNDLKTSSLATREDRELFRLIGTTAREELLGGAGSGAVSSVPAARTSGADDGGPAVHRARAESESMPDSGSILEAALRTQVEKLAGKGTEPSSFLLGPPGAPTVGEAQNH